MIRIKCPYGVDHKGTKTAFYWADSDQKRSEVMSIRRGAPATFEATYQGRPGAREGSIFIREDMVFYKPPFGLIEGLRSETVLKFVQKGHGIFQAWDTAYEETKHSAWSVCVTAMVVACNQYHRGEDPKIVGPCDNHFDVVILEVFRKKLEIGDLVAAIREQHLKWRAESVIIEKKSSGIAALQALKSSDVPIVAVAADVGKRARAIEGVGAGSAQGWFRLHRVQFPESAPWLKIYVTELKDFSGADDAISDQVDATVHLLRHVIIMGSRTTMLPTGWTPERGNAIDVFFEDGGLMFSDTDSGGGFLTILGELHSMAVDPFSGSCGRCEYFENGNHCRVHRRARAALDTCHLYTDRVAGGSQTTDIEGIGLGR